MTIFVTYGDRDKLRRPIARQLDADLTRHLERVCESKLVEEAVYPLIVPPQVRQTILDMSSDTMKWYNKVQKYAIHIEEYKHLGYLRLSHKDCFREMPNFSVIPLINLNDLPADVSSFICEALNDANEVANDIETWSSFCEGPLSRVRTMGQLEAIWPAASRFLTPRNKSDGKPARTKKPIIAHIPEVTEKQKILLMKLNMGLIG